MRSCAVVLLPNTCASLYASYALQSAKCYQLTALSAGNNSTCCRAIQMHVSKSLHVQTAASLAATMQSSNCLPADLEHSGTCQHSSTWNAFYTDQCTEVSCSGYMTFAQVGQVSSTNSAPHRSWRIRHSRCERMQATTRQWWQLLNKMHCIRCCKQREMQKCTATDESCEQREMQNALHQML
jgi:hypothetical protein